MNLPTLTVKAMPRWISAGLMLAAIAGWSGASMGATGGATTHTPTMKGRVVTGGKPMQERRMETATLAGGCFWCLEAIFQPLRGVDRIVSGYAGGTVANPSYEQVSSGRTGHAEAVQITFDPEAISYREILEIFFAFHDPTTRDRQGNDVGTQYRSAIFVQSPEQKATAGEVIAELTRQRVFPDPIVTQVAPLKAFYPAEGYHQDYYRTHQDQPYCQVVIAPKVAKLRAKYAARLKGETAPTQR